jgi:hypothetical protein
MVLGLVTTLQAFAVDVNAWVWVIRFHVCVDDGIIAIEGQYPLICCGNISNGYSNSWVLIQQNHSFIEHIFGYSVWQDIVPDVLDL